MTSGIVRRGDRLLRPMGPWSPAVHEYLRHLEAAGFEGSPRVLGIEGDREVLTFIDGDVAVDPQWDPGMGTGSLRMPGPISPCAARRPFCANCTSASTGFQPAMTSYRFHPRLPRAGEIISHGDLGPWNTVYRDGLPVALIDWDSAQPASPLADLADAAWTFLPLAPPSSWSKRDSARFLTCPLGCACSWTPTAKPTVRRSCQHWCAASWPGQQTGGPTPLMPPCCAGSKASRRTWLAPCDSH